MLGALVSIGLPGRQQERPTMAASSSGTAHDNDWRYYGRTAAADRFAPQSQITPANVANLAMAWTNRSGDSADPAEIRHEREFHSESTPLKIDNTLYSCFPHSVVVALDATTGTTKWRFDPKVARKGNPYLVCRGVAYYEVSDPNCPKRIYSPVFDARIVALNADAGQPCTSFADAGYIDQLQNLDSSPTGFTITTSPPMIINDRMIVGSRIRDNQAVDEPSGVIRAYDPRTGQLVWAWDMGRGDDAIAPPDYFIKNRRPFDDKYGSAIVALDIKTGKQRWALPDRTSRSVGFRSSSRALPCGPSIS
jgi:quinoprotein glucose dehydrogenase